MSLRENTSQRISTGIPGLDRVLGGGLTPDSLYLLQGDPGVGKTTLAMQFLIEGEKRGENVLYVTLSESRREMLDVARSHDWSLEKMPMYELTTVQERLRLGSAQTMFHPAEVELDETIKPMLAEVDRLKATRVVIDSLSEMRLVALDGLRYRRLLLSLKQFFAERHCTLLLVDDKTAESGDSVLQTLAHGVIVLEKVSPLFGSPRRRLTVSKFRGSRFSEGYHDYRIETGGVVVYPRLVASEHSNEFTPAPLSSGMNALDTLLGGGLDRGTSTLLIGSAGTGKSTLSTQFALAAAARQESAAILSFEESEVNWRRRSLSLGLRVDQYVESGLLRFTPIDPAELSPGEFAAKVRQAVEVNGAKVVIIDSLNGYLQSVPEENFLLLHLHELLTYLGQKGVATVLVVTQHGLMGSGMQAPVDVSYLADAVVLLRYFEAKGEVRQAISVVKKRSGQHERAIREFQIASGGIHVGEPLRNFHGVLTGVPTYQGDSDPLLKEVDARTAE